MCSCVKVVRECVERALSHFCLARSFFSLKWNCLSTIQKKDPLSSYTQGENDHARIEKAGLKTLAKQHFTDGCNVPFYDAVPRDYIRLAGTNNHSTGTPRSHLYTPHQHWQSYSRQHIEFVACCCETQPCSRLKTKNMYAGLNSFVNKSFFDF